MLRRIPPYEACGGTTGFSPWGLHLPERVEVIEKMPLTNVGKIDKKRLREMELFVIPTEHQWQSQAELRRSHPTSPCGLRRGHLSPFLPVLPHGASWRRRVTKEKLKKESRV